MKFSWFRHRAVERADSLLAEGHFGDLEERLKAELTEAPSQETTEAHLSRMIAAASTARLAEANASSPTRSRAVVFRTKTMRKYASVAGAVAVLLGAFGGIAAAGILPPPVQRWVSHESHHLGISFPLPHSSAPTPTTTPGVTPGTVASSPRPPAGTPPTTVAPGRSTATTTPAKTPTSTSPATTSRSCSAHASVESVTADLLSPTSVVIAVTVTGTVTDSFSAGVSWTATTAPYSSYSFTGRLAPTGAQDFQGTITTTSPIPLGAAVVVGTCSGAVQGHTTVVPPYGATTPTTSTDTPTASVSCSADAVVESVTANLLSPTSVVIAVTVTGTVTGSFSAGVSWTATTAPYSSYSFTGRLAPTDAQDFQGTITTTSPVPLGAAVVVGTCSGAVQGHTTVQS